RENRKFIQAPSPESWSETISGTEGGPGEEVGWPVLGYLLGKNFRRRDRDRLVPPRRMDAAVCRAEVCYPFGREHWRHRAVRRREFITLFGGAAAAWPLAAPAQQAPMPVVGFLSSSSPRPYATMVAAFRQGLKEGGYVEGQNVGIEVRWAENDLSRLPMLAVDLISQAAVVATSGGYAPTHAAKGATTTIPIVFVSAGDPVAAGLVASINRPAGNITGVNFFTRELGAKRLEVLREIVPKAKRIALL